MFPFNDRSTDERKHQSSTSLAFVRGNPRLPVDSPHKGPVTRKMFPFNYLIMLIQTLIGVHNNILSLSDEVQVKILLKQIHVKIPVWPQGVLNLASEIYLSRFYLTFPHNDGIYFQVMFFFQRTLTSIQAIKYKGMYKIKSSWHTNSIITN